MKKSIPFGFLPLNTLKRMSWQFVGIAAAMEKAFPSLKMQLKQADLDIKPKEYISIMILLSLTYFLATLVLTTAFLSKFLADFFFLSVTISLFISSMIFVQLSLYPRILVKKKVRKVEKNLVFALRTMLVQIKSGVSLYQAMKIIAEGKHGTLSKEFEKMIRKVNAGIHQEIALQEMADETPSPIFRRIVWQIVNGLKGGGDIEKIIRESLNGLSRQQRIGIQRYGAQLRVLSLVYMMIGIIIPALGLAFLIVLGSFPRLVISEIIFWALLGGIAVMEFMFIGLIKSKRPTLISD